MNDMLCFAVENGSGQLEGIYDHQRTKICWESVERVMLCWKLTGGFLIILAEACLEGCLPGVRTGSVRNEISAGTDATFGENCDD